MTMIMMATPQKKSIIVTLKMVGKTRGAKKSILMKSLNQEISPLILHGKTATSMTLMTRNISGYCHHLWVVSSPYSPPNPYSIASRMMQWLMAQRRAMKKMSKNFLCPMCKKEHMTLCMTLCGHIVHLCCTEIYRGMSHLWQKSCWGSALKDISPRSDEIEWLGGIT